MDKALLFKSRLPEGDVEVPGVGTVRVRGLSRAEAYALQEAEQQPDVLARERVVVALCMVSPPLTEDEVGEWQKVSPAGELEAVSDKIGELSGMLDDSAKEVVKGFEADPAAEFRVLPGVGTGDDGREPAHRDEQ